MNYKLDRLRSQIADLVARNQALVDQIADERRTRIETQAETELAQNVKAPKQLAMLLQAEGALLERGGELLVETSQGLRPLADGVSGLLGTDDYEHFRPSATSKEAPGNGVSGRFLQGGDRVPTDAEIAQALANPGESELFAELEEMLDQPTTQATYDSVRPQNQMQPSTSDLMPTDAEIEAAMGDPAKFALLAARVEAAMS